MSTPRSFHRRSATLALLATGCLLGTAAGADEKSGKISLSGYADAAAGEELLAADYTGVIRALGPHGVAFSRDPLAASTNLCVAYIMTHDWSKADGACDEAVRLARLEPGSQGLYERRAHDHEVAIAYSNRAVLRSLEADPSKAANDLARASALAPGSELVTHNRAALTLPGGS